MTTVLSQVLKLLVYDFSTLLVPLLDKMVLLCVAKVLCLLALRSVFILCFHACHKHLQFFELFGGVQCLLILNN